MNLNDLAKQITEKEGLKKSMTIAQVKEVLRITLSILADMDLLTLAKTLAKYSN